MNRAHLQSLLTRRGALVVVAVVAVALAGAFATLRLQGSDEAAKPAAERQLSVLAEPFAADDTTVQSCEGMDPVQRTDCRKQALANIAFRNGPDAAFAELKRLADANPQDWAGDTHIVQHGVGSGALAYFKDDVGSAIAAGGRSTSTPGTGGYLHGILLVGLAGASRDELASRAATFCDSPQVRRDSSQTYWCLHGMGHSLMIYTGNDLPWALSSCDELGTTSDEYGCYIGTFMENWGEFMPMMQRNQVRSKWVSDDVRYPCNAVDRKYRGACYIQITIRAAPQVGGDFARLAALCRTVERDFQQTCFRAGGTFSYDVGRGDPLAMARLCGMLGEGVDACTGAAASALIGTKDPTGREAATLCKASPADVQLGCWSAVGGLLHQRNPAEQQKGCRAFAPAAQLATCLRVGSAS